MNKKTITPDAGKYYGTIDGNVICLYDTVWGHAPYVSNLGDLYDANGYITPDMALFTSTRKETMVDFGRHIVCESTDNEFFDHHLEKFHEREFKNNE